MRINADNGFTLIEIMIVVSVMAVLIMGGSLVMFKTMSSRGQNQIDININQAASQIVDMIEKGIAFSIVGSVGGSTRQMCIDAGSTGVEGSTLTVSDVWGSTTYSLNLDDNIASNSTVVSTSNVIVSDLSFRWFCVSGYPDKIRVSFTLDDLAADSGVLDRTFRRDINMYNSGI